MRERVAVRGGPGAAQNVVSLGSRALDLLANRSSEDNEADGESLQVHVDWWSKFNASCGIVEAGPKV